MVDAMREALDALMGGDRNAPPEEQNKPKPRWKMDDPKLCKNYLCGFCPAEEFQRTKHDFGTCALVHAEDAKQQWDELSDEERDKFGYENELKRFMDTMMDELRRKIQRNEQRLKQNEIPVLVSSEQANINLMSTKIAELMRQSEKLGEEGEVDGAQAAAAQIETLKVQKAALEKEAAARSAKKADSKQYVCEISAVIVNNDETRIRDHLSGRNYKSWARAHEKYKELKEVLRKRDICYRTVRLRDADRERDRRRDSGSRHEDRDSSKDRERDRGRDGHRDRDGERSSSRRRERSRERDRAFSSRDRERDRDRDRDRDRRR